LTTLLARYLQAFSMPAEASFRHPQLSQTLDQAGVDQAPGAAIWAGLVRVPVSSLLWHGIGGEEQRGPQADEPDHGQGGHRQPIGSGPGGQVGHQDGAGDGGAQR
jgi:hypothetical protein